MAASYLSTPSARPSSLWGVSAKGLTPSASELPSGGLIWRAQPPVPQGRPGALARRLAALLLILRRLGLLRLFLGLRSS